MVKEIIFIPALDTRITVLDQIERSANRPVLNLCDINGESVWLTDKALNAWRLTAACWEMVDAHKRNEVENEI